MEARLHGLLLMVNEWLRFAEAKNAALVALVGAAIAGVLQVAGPVAQLPWGWRAYVYQFVALASLSVIGGLTSFIPTVNFGAVRPRGAKAAADNVLFFGTAARYSPEYYLQQLYALEGVVPPAPLPSAERLYAHQIVVNSRIALWKLDRFTLAAWACVCACATPPLAAIVWYVNKHTRVEPVDQ